MRYMQTVPHFGHRGPTLLRHIILVVISCSDSHEKHAALAAHLARAKVRAELRGVKGEWRELVWARIVVLSFPNNSQDDGFACLWRG